MGRHILFICFFLQNQNVILTSQDSGEGHTRALPFISLGLSRCICKVGAIKLGAWAVVRMPVENDMECPAGGGECCGKGL